MDQTTILIALGAFGLFHLIGDRSLRMALRLIMVGYLLFYTALPPSWQDPFHTMPSGSWQQWVFFAALLWFIFSYFWEKKEEA